METAHAARFDIELVEIGPHKTHVEQLLNRVKGLASSPAEILASSPCMIAVNISGGAAKKLTDYLKQTGAKVRIQLYGHNTSSPSSAQLQRIPKPAPIAASPIATTSIMLKRSVNELLRALESKDWKTRELAVIELGTFPSDGVVRHLLKALKDDVWHVRYAALDVLSRMNSGVVLREMTKCLEDDVWHVRYQAVDALSRIESDKIIKPLLAALRDENWQVRQRVVDTLGELQSKRTLNGLIFCLDDDVWHVRESAVRALAKLRSDKSVKALLKALDDPNWQVRSMAISALWKIGSEQSIRPLIDRLDDEEWMVHWKAAYALGKIGTANIFTLLLHMANTSNILLKEAAQSVLQSFDVVVEPQPNAAPKLEYRSRDAHAAICYVPAGEFIMGMNAGPENARPAHSVFVDAFFIDKYEVTNAQYSRFNPSHEYPEGMEHYPVVNVTWDEAKAYAAWIGKRLPREAEWEKASRGIDSSLYPWGMEFDATMCNTAESDNRGTTPVDKYPQGKSSFHVCDMIGNVLEWMGDTYLPYPSSRYESPDFPEQFIVLRGGSWIHQGAEVTCATRLYAPADNRSNFIGFRCVKDVKE